MKKMILTLAIAISSFAVFAGEVNVSSKVMNSFQKEFSGVENVQWSLGSNCYKASFLYNGQHVIAFYDFDGEMLGLTRNISSLELPLGLQAKLKKDYSDFWISDLFEVSNETGTRYYITLEKAESKIILESVGGGNWDTYKKLAKS